MSLRKKIDMSNEDWLEFEINNTINKMGGDRDAAIESIYRWAIEFVDKSSKKLKKGIKITGPKVSKAASLQRIIYYQISVRKRIPFIRSFVSSEVKLLKAKSETKLKTTTERNRKANFSQVKESSEVKEFKKSDRLRICALYKRQTGINDYGFLLSNFANNEFDKKYLGSKLSSTEKSLDGLSEILCDRLYELISELPSGPIREDLLKAYESL